MRMTNENKDDPECLVFETFIFSHSLRLVLIGLTSIRRISAPLISGNARNDWPRVAETVTFV